MAISKVKMPENVIIECDAQSERDSSGSLDKYNFISGGKISAKLASGKVPSQGS